MSQRENKTNFVTDELKQMKPTCYFHKKFELKQTRTKGILLHDRKFTIKQLSNFG
jgi:hypothetical protein